MSGLISRQAAIDAFWKLEAELRPSAIDAVLDMLKNLPSAQPEVKGAIKSLREILEKAKAKTPEDSMLVEVSVPVYIAEVLAYSQPDKDMIHLQKEQAYMQGWEDAKTSAQPERRTGTWELMFNGQFKGGAYWFSCSKCNRIVPEVRNGGWDFCPNCGARMVQEGEDSAD